MKLPTVSGASGGPAATAALRVWWRTLPGRQRNLLVLAGVVVLGALLWWVALQPALQTVRSAPAELDTLEGQLQTMQRLAAEATELRATPPVNPEQAAAALKAATERLGDKARLNLQGDRAVLTLNGAGTGAVRDWLAEARSGARARPVEASLMRGTQGYSGTIVLAIGGAP
jgi:general secretion pathway protein M